LDLSHSRSIRVYGLRPVSLQTTRSCRACRCARRWILALAGLDFERFVLIAISRQALPNSQSIVSKGQPCTGATRATSRVLADGNILSSTLSAGPSGRVRPPSRSLRDAGNTPSLAASLSAPSAESLLRVCREWSWDRSSVRAAPGPTCSCRALEPLVSSRSVQLAVRLPLARFI
jgi:hypothetical protein